MEDAGDEPGFLTTKGTKDTKEITERLSPANDRK